MGSPPPALRFLLAGVPACSWLSRWGQGGGDPSGEGGNSDGGGGGGVGMVAATLAADINKAFQGTGSAEARSVFF